MEKEKDMSVLNEFEMGIGTWAWGDGSVWKFGQGYGENDLREAFFSSVGEGIHLFDTAEVYGRGKSETFLATRSVRSSMTRV